MSLSEYSSEHFESDSSQNDARWWGVLHLSTLLGWVLPLFGVVAPFLVVLCKGSSIQGFRERGMAYVRLQLKFLVLPLIFLGLWLGVFLAYGLYLVWAMAKGEDLGLVESFWRLGQMILNATGEGEFSWSVIMSTFLHPSLQVVTAVVIAGVGSLVWPIFKSIYAFICCMRSDAERVSKAYVFEGVGGTLLLLVLALIPHLVAGVMVWNALTQSQPPEPPPTHFL
jgi:uncharacterized Tic20 family protein